MNIGGQMKRIRMITILLLAALMIETLFAPWQTVYGSSPDADTHSREKIYFELLRQNTYLNKSDHAILRVTKVDYATGLNSSEDIVMDFIDTSKDYNFWGSGGTNREQNYPFLFVVKDIPTETEKIISYSIKNKTFNVITERSSSGESIERVLPDNQMYIVKNDSGEYKVYSLVTNKLLHTTKLFPSVKTDSLLGYDNFDLSYGALYFENNEGSDTYAYELESNGSITKLKPFKTRASTQYSYKKTLSSSVIYKKSLSNKVLRQELVVDGKIKTLHEANMKKSDYSIAVAQLSPNHKYIVLWVGFVEDKRRVKGKEEYRIFDATTGDLIRTIPINTTGITLSSMDYGIRWVNNTDHIIQSGLLNRATYRTIDTSNIITPWNYGNITFGSSSNTYYNFSLDELLSLNDPIPVSFNGEYMHYSGQGTFRIANLTTYAPVTDVMEFLQGSVSMMEEEVTVNYHEQHFTLDSSKQIVWRNEVYYPLREMLSGIGLKLSVKGEQRANDQLVELEIIE